jgi:thiamine-phosphate pyrophosphorylase
MRPRTRLYLITPPRIADPAAFERRLFEALDAGDVACLQVRLKEADGTAAPDEAIRRLCARIVAPAQSRGVAVIINDRPDLAVEVGADGVHVGPSDISCGAARRIVGEERIVGVTCRDSRHLALEAGEAGADYVAFGAFFPSGTKTDTAVASPDLLTWWQEMIEIPCVAIGGVTPENAAGLVSAGADFLAVSAGVWDRPEGPAAAVRAFNRVFDDLSA